MAKWTRPVMLIKNICTLRGRKRLSYVTFDWNHNFLCKGIRTISILFNCDILTVIFIYLFIYLSCVAPNREMAGVTLYGLDQDKEMTAWTVVNTIYLKVASVKYESNVEKNIRISWQTDKFNLIKHNDVKIHNTSKIQI